MTEPIHAVHPSLWEELLQLDINDICRRSGAQGEEASGSYVIDFLRERYHIDTHTRTFDFVTGPAPEGVPSIDLQVVLITYLLKAQERPLTTKLVAANTLKGGATFFQGAHRFPLDPLIKRYGSDPEGFLTQGLSLGATPERYGDASLRFQALPRIPVILVLWKGDEEFPPRLNVLFDASIEHHLPLDAVYGLVSEICRRMANKDKGQG